MKSEDEDKLMSRRHGKCLQGWVSLGLAQLVSGHSTSISQVSRDAQTLV